MSVLTFAAEDRYATEAVVVAMGDNLADDHDPRVWSPFPGLGDGVAVLLRWACEVTGSTLHIAVVAPICTPQAMALLDLRAGDVVYVEGRIEGFHWPGLLGNFAVMCSPIDIEVIRRGHEPEIEPASRGA